jgi:glycosyltransferase involved in cell wall biosynthesis
MITAEFLIIFSIILIIIQTLFFLFYNYRTKKNTDKIVHNFSLERKELLKEIQMYYSRIELRMVQPFKQFEKANNNIIWIVVFTINRKDLLTETIQSLRKSEPDVNILIVDNGSTDGTHELLHEWINTNIIQKVVLNRKEDIPQWQKCFNIHQAFQVLASEKIDYIGWIDDDMTVKKPWKNLIIHALGTLSEQNVRMVSLLNDDIQKYHHPPLKSVTVNQEQGDIKATINGNFVVFPVDLLHIFGLPPIREGINDLGVEDWYYSRLLQASGYYCIAFDIAIHHGYDKSIREQLEKL